MWIRTCYTTSRDTIITHAAPAPVFVYVTHDTTERSESLSAMRLRFFVLCVLLLALIGPASAAAATRSLDSTVDRGLLRSLMVTRDRLVPLMIAADTPRGQSLALTALGIAETMLAAHTAALARAIARLTPRPAAPRWPPHRPAHPRPRRPRLPAPAAPAPGPPVTVAGPATLWAPGSRLTTSMAPRWSLPDPAAPATGGTPGVEPGQVARPFVMSVQALTSWTSLLPTDSGTSGAATTVEPSRPAATVAATPRTQSEPEPTATISTGHAVSGSPSVAPVPVPSASGPGEPRDAHHALPNGTPTTAPSAVSTQVATVTPLARAPVTRLGQPPTAFTRVVTVTLRQATPLAQSYGGVRVDAGSGAEPLIAANGAVSSTILTPIPAPTATSTATPSPTKPPTATPIPTPRPPDRATLLGRWRTLSATLARVRALRAWVRATAPTPAIRSGDVISTTDLLHDRLDTWSATPPLAVASDAPLVMPPDGPLDSASGYSETAPLSVAVPADALGAAVSLSGSVPSTATVAPHLAFDGRIAPITTTNGGDAVLSLVSDTTARDVATSALTVPVALNGAVLRSVGVTATTDGGTPIPTLAYPLSSTLDTSATVVTGDAAALGASPTPADTTGTATPASPLTGASPAPSDTPTLSDTTGTVTPTASLTNTTAVTPSASLTDTTAVTPAVSGPVSLTMTAWDGSGTTVMTVTSTLSGASPYTLVVTLPGSVTAAAAPAGSLSQRGELESVLRDGETIFARLKAEEPSIDADYQTRLHGVAALNSGIESRWNTAMGAYEGYIGWQQRTVAYNGYVHRLRQAGIRYAQWQTAYAAYTLYAQQLHAYTVAVNARQVPLPLKPVAPPFPGPQPLPFTEQAPAWPGAQPPFAPYPGPRPSGYALPLPPAAIPPWDGASLPAAILNYVGTSVGCCADAVGRQETTQASLLAAGALNGIGSYQDPVKGTITTYWGGSNFAQAFHTGVDIANDLYTPIHAVADGIVVFAGYAVPGDRHASYGMCVEIKHNDHIDSFYAHMDDLVYGLSVRQGDIVRQGQVIGHIGLTGLTNGAHLHFEMRQDGMQFDPLLLIPNPQD